MNSFKSSDDCLTEGHIKQICRFLRAPYIEGEYQRMNAYAQFKKWHHDKLKERDRSDLALLAGNVK
jgi:hypothetical protein